MDKEEISDTERSGFSCRWCNGEQPDAESVDGSPFESGTNDPAVNYKLTPYDRNNCLVISDSAQAPTASSVNVGVRVEPVSGVLRIHESTKWYGTSTRAVLCFCWTATF